MKYYISLNITKAAEIFNAPFPFTTSGPLRDTILCDNPSCKLNPSGLCLAPLLTGQPPDIDHPNGCPDYIPKDTN